jgi:adenylate cyclase
MPRRMESTGAAGKIEVSQAAYEHRHGELVLNECGEIEVRGKGAMRTWFLVERKARAGGSRRVRRVGDPVV